MRYLIVALVVLILTSNVYSSDSLGYTGRLVNANGSPVTGPVDLSFDIALSNNTGSILCHHEMDGVPLTNGVFHVKIEFASGECSSPLSTILASGTPIAQPSIRVVDRTPTPDKEYSFQALQAIPYAVVSNVAKTLAPLSVADTGKVLQWNGTEWVPATLGSGTGSVNNVSTGTGLTGGPITTTGTISIANGGVGTTQLADGAVTDIKLAGSVSRSKIAAGAASQVVVNDGTGALSSVATVPLGQGGTGAANATDARTNLGLGAAAVLGVGYTGTNLMPGAGVPTCFSGFKLQFTGAGPTWWSCIAEDGNDNSKLPLAGGTMVGAIEMSGFKVTGLPTPVDPDDAANKDYVDNQISAESVWDKTGGDVFRPSGRVGIGTNSPSYQLHNAAPSGTAVDLLLSGITGLTNGFGIQYNGATTGNYMKYYFLDGNVGIGTTNPTTKLAIAGTDNAISVADSTYGYDSATPIGLKIANWSSENAAGIKFNRWKGTATNFVNAYIGQGGPGIWGLDFRVDDVASNIDPTTSRMYVSANGVGFGTLTPTATVHLKAGSSSTNTAPLKFTSGPTLTTPEPGAVEFDGTNLYFTDSTSTRKALATSVGATSIQPANGSAGSPSYSFSTDTNTGFYSSGADQIGISAGGAQIFSFGANGLVSPVAGGGAVSSGAGSAATPTFSFAGDADTGWYSPAADTLAAATAGAERIRISSGGRIGIGTTNPLYKIHTSAPVYESAIMVDKTGTADGGTGLITRMPDESYGGWFIGMRDDITGGPSGVEQFRIMRDTTPVMNINTVGQVGLGIVNPSARLHAVTADAGPTIISEGTSTSSFEGLRVANNTPYGAGGGVQASKISLGKNEPGVYRAMGEISAAPSSDNSSSDGYLTFSTRSAGASSEKMRITESGNVGIGTTSPPYKLSIAGTGQTVLLVNGTSATGGGGAIAFGMGAAGVIDGSVGNLSAIMGAGTSNDVIMNAQNSNSILLQTMGSYPIRFNTNQTERMRIDSSGNVGIGTTSPSSTLDVGGTSNTAFIQNLSTWGLNARTQGLIIIPEGTVTDDGAGNLILGGSLIVMNPLSGSFIRVAAGTYNLPAWASLVIDIPATTTARTIVTPTVVAWNDSDRNFDGRDKLVLAQRFSIYKIYTRFSMPANSSVADAPITTPSVTAGTVYGGTSASGNLILDSTSNASKGNVVIAPSGGNVGIGTSSPYGMLANTSSNVTDQVGIGVSTSSLNWNTFAQGYVAAFNNTSSGNWYNGVLAKIADTSANSYIFNAISGTTSKFAIQGDGNVGIGTATPIWPLQIDANNSSSPAGVTLNTYENGSNTTGTQVRMSTARGTKSSPTNLLSGDFIGSVAWSGHWTGKSTTGFNTGEAKSSINIYATENWSSSNNTGTMMTFSTTSLGSGTGSEKMRIDSVGNIGIGTTNPTSKFQVKGTGSTLVQIESDDATNNNSIANQSGLISLFGGNMYASGARTRFLSAGDRAFMDYRTEPGGRGTWILGRQITTQSDTLTVHGDGKVGIGTSSPTDLLTVNGNSRLGLADTGIATVPVAGSTLYFSGGTAVASTDNTDTMSIFRYDTAANVSELRVNIGDDPVDNPTVEDTFVIGAGYPSWNPVMTVRAAGKVGIGTSTPSEKLEVAGNVKATEFLYTSDRRLKKDIKTISDVEKLFQLRGVHFKWIADGKPSMGFIAQEVEKVYPELVRTDKKSGHKSVQYGNITAVLVEALKEEITVRKAEHNETKKELKNLKKENDELRSRLERLENLITKNKK